MMTREMMTVAAAAQRFGLTVEELEARLAHYGIAPEIVALMRCINVADRNVITALQHALPKYCPGCGVDLVWWECECIPEDYEPKE